MYRLFVDSTTGVDVEPEYDFTEKDRKVESRHRTKSGKEFVYKFGDYNNFKFKVMYVNSSFKDTVNGWWSNNTELLWMEEGGTEVFSVHLQNKDKPIGGFIMPYTDLFKGTIDLTTY